MTENVYIWTIVLCLCSSFVCHRSRKFFRSWPHVNHKLSNALNYMFLPNRYLCHLLENIANILARTCTKKIRFCPFDMPAQSTHTTCTTFYYFSFLDASLIGKWNFWKEEIFLFVILPAKSILYCSTEDLVTGK